MSPNQSDGQSLPVDEVISMRDDGYDNNEIIQALQDDGYSSSAIFDALNEADMAEIDDDMGPAPSAGDMGGGEQGSAEDDVTNEELIEEIIEEKWHTLTDDLKKVIEWKDRSEQRLQDMEEEIKSLKDSMQEVQNSVGNRLEDYDATMRDVQEDVHAMENAFSDALPKFTENVSEMRSLIETMRDTSSPQQTRDTTRSSERSRTDDTAMGTTPETLTVSDDENDADQAEKSMSADETPIDTDSP